MSDVLKCLAIAFTVVLLVFCLATAIMYPFARVDAKVLNAQFGTSYSTFDFMWMTESTKKAVYGQKHRLELNQIGE